MVSLTLSLVSCSASNKDAEIVIVVDSDFQVPGELNEVSFYVKRVGAPETLSQSTTVPLTGGLGEALPLRLGIAPDGDAEAAVEVRVEGRLIVDAKAPRPEPLVRRKARLRFQRGKVLLLRMDLVHGCAYPKYVECEGEANAGTCDEHGCSDIEDPAVHPWTGSENAHSPWDAGPSHQPADAGPSADDGGPMAESDGKVPDLQHDGGPEEEAEVPVELALGEAHSCVRTSRGNVWCWGANDYGQLGDGNTDHAQKCLSLDDSVTMPIDCSFAPVQAADLPKVSQLSAGVYTTCAVHEPRAVSDANLSCWGEVPEDTTPTPRGIRYQSLLLDDVSEVRVGGKHACARRKNHLPVCWGEYVTGELGNGDAENYPDGDITEATKLKGLVQPSDLTMLALGDRHSCAMLATGGVLCWGGNEVGESGAPLTTDPLLTPTQVPGDHVAHVRAVMAGGAHTCVIAKDGGAYCWGQDTFGELGIGDPNLLAECSSFNRCSEIPRRVQDDELGASIVQVAAGYEFTCGRLSDGRVACWGRNTYGQLGPKVVDTESALPVEALKQKTLQVALGAEHACAILEDHSVVCWGRNDFVQLGTSPGEATSSKTPLKVPLEL
jgi:alpha-tubulin suppressor-like RCC1 family protein